MSVLPPRDIGALNWLGVRTHITKEIHRFFKVGLQTLLAPAATTLMFLAIFTLALGRSVQVIAGIPFVEFLAPGLIIMAIIQNSYANTVSSVMISKIQGNIVDMLMPPAVTRRVYHWFCNGWYCAWHPCRDLRGVSGVDFCTSKNP